MKVDLPLLLYLIFVLFIIVLIDSQFPRTGVLVVIIMGIIVFLILLFRVLKYLIDYYMDFIVFTEKYLFRYNQEGLFKRDIITVNSEHIKSVSVEKKGLLNSLFNQGNLIFFTEGDEEHGEITLDYILNPEKNKDLIMKIIKE